MRLHRDGRGLASIEFILSAPVILLIVIAVRQANLLSVRRIDTMREVRSAAFAEASGLTCTSDFSQTIPIPIPQIASALPAGQGPERTTCSSQPSNGGGGDPSRTFVWDDVNKKAKSVSDNLAGDLANEKPTLVTATATRVYRYSTNPLTKPFRWTDRFTVDDSTLFASTNDTTRRGYDPTLRKSIRNVASGAGDLFDGIFPGAK
ncbi:hypothetical protein GGD46_004350 [Rhizobium lusitanum]|uniref:Pilus assembly protein n=2 Tax=Rhizobium lusitanum TaxID=293958 RepID=A0A7X0ITT2_9HYPH|nr:hypothetical protein [Rhizobium lusitanum]